MSKFKKTILVFTLSFIISYLIVGYIANTMFIQIHWDEGATLWNKFNEYYIRSFSINFIPALILAIIPATIYNKKSYK